VRASGQHACNGNGRGATATRNAVRVVAIAVVAIVVALAVARIDTDASGPLAVVGAADDDTRGVAGVAVGDAEAVGVRHEVSDSRDTVPLALERNDAAVAVLHVAARTVDTIRAW
jgi:hypothetical protein